MQVLSSEEIQVPGGGLAFIPMIVIAAAGGYAGGYFAGKFF